MTDMETKRARGKCIANALVCQLCWTFLFVMSWFFSLSFLVTPFTTGWSRASARESPVQGTTRWVRDHEPVMGVWGLCPSGVQRQSILAFICIMESESLCVLHIITSKASVNVGLLIDFSHFLCHVRRAKTVKGTLSDCSLDPPVHFIQPQKSTKPTGISMAK